MSKGKQPEVDGGEGVKSSNIKESLPKAISKSMGCCGVEFLGGGVRASYNEEADEKLPDEDGQDDEYGRDWLLKPKVKLSSASMF
jgi:hypothetical protein